MEERGVDGLEDKGGIGRRAARGFCNARRSGVCLLEYFLQGAMSLNVMRTGSYFSLTPIPSLILYTWRK